MTYIFWRCPTTSSIQQTPTHYPLFHSHKFPHLSSTLLLLPQVKDMSAQLHYKHPVRRARTHGTLDTIWPTVHWASSSRRWWQHRNITHSASSAFPAITVGRVNIFLNAAYKGTTERSPKVKNKYGASVEWLYWRENDSVRRKYVWPSVTYTALETNPVLFRP